MAKRVFHWAYGLLLVSLVAVSVFVFSTSGGKMPYLSDELLERFSTWADQWVVPFQIEATVYDEDVGLSYFRRGYCTAPIVKVTDQAIYGVVANHCVQNTSRRTIEGVYVLGLPAFVLSYHNPPNEVRIWRISNAGRLLPNGEIAIAQRSWWPGVQVFVVGVQRMKHGGDDRTKDVFDRWYTRGSIQTAQRGFDLDEVGDLNHSAPITFGFSGGPAFVYNTRTKQFELLAINNALEVVSLFSYSYSINREEVLKAIAQDVVPTDDTADHSQPMTPPNRAHFSNWDSVPYTVQQSWDAWYAANEEYSLTPFDAVIVSNHRVPIGPKETVQDAWLNNRLPVRGKLQEVNWSEFAYQQEEP